MLCIGAVPVLALAPVADANGPYEYYETDPIEFNGAHSYDPEGDPLMYRWDYDSNGINDTDWSSNALGGWTWLDDFTGSATLWVSDGTSISSDTSSVLILNIDPYIDESSLSGPTDPIWVGNLSVFGASFWDKSRSEFSSQDSFTATFSWGDGSQSALALPAGSTFVSANHVYSVAGVYTVMLTILDDDGGSSVAYFNPVVVFEPNVQPGTGFVTGGGWIMSPAGSYKPNMTLSGKTTFGFVAKYRNGQNIPNGNTEFQFHAAGMNFHATDYQWLIVAGPQAKFKGNGTINGAGNYGFMLTGIDGSLAGDGNDRIRMKIWDKDTGEMVYDNLDDTILSNGQIIIHR
jgi:hypothetical protein